MLTVRTLDDLRLAGTRVVQMDLSVPWSSSMAAVSPPTLKHGRAVSNEVFWFGAHPVLGEISAATLTVHRTKDTFVPIESARQAATKLKAGHKLVKIGGSQRGFAPHDDPQYLQPQRQGWQAFVIRTVAE